MYYRLEIYYLDEYKTFLKNFRKLNEEEKEAQKRYFERLKEDEILAKQLQQESSRTTTVSKTPKRRTITVSLTKPRLRPTTIDSYLKKSSVQATIVNK